MKMPDETDDREEKVASFNDANVKTGKGTSTGDSKSKSTTKGATPKEGDESKSTKGGGKKKNKDKKKKTAHFKKRGTPIFRILTIVFSLLAVLCIIGAVIFGIMLANEASSA